MNFLRDFTFRPDAIKVMCVLVNPEQSVRSQQTPNSTRSRQMASWVPYAADHPFPIQNLPYGVFRTSSHPPTPCTAIGDFVVDLRVLASKGFFDHNVAEAFHTPTLNAFMALGYDTWKAVRQTLSKLFDAKEAVLRDDAATRAVALIPSATVEMLLPANIGDYTDFYASREHASNLGRLFRPGQPPLLENWLHIPVGYHGRASSIVVSGTPLHRPNGQSKPKPEEPPVFGPSKGLDFELEMAAYIGTGNNLGEPITVDEAPKHIFGFSVFNDWSARDLQKWEYVPLGPFLGKNFGSTISPWIVSTFAMEPFLTPGPAQDPTPLPYLQQKTAGNYDVNLTVTLTTAENESMVISRTNFKLMYWSFAQMLAHHTVNGCNMRPGDVIASGTISGTEPGTFGSLIELTSAGAHPITLPSGAQRRMLQDFDTLGLAGVCNGEGYCIGFGACLGRVLPAATK